VEKLDVLLPAGGRLPADFARVAGTDIKALIRFDEQTILSRTLSALRASPRFGRLLVIGPQELQEDCDTYQAERITDHGSGPDNIFRGLEHLSAQERVMILTTDLPFLSGSILEEFLTSCPSQADICAPVVLASDYADRFPGSTATFVKLRDENITLGCAYLLKTQALRAVKPNLDAVFEQRKSKMGMAKLLGAQFVFQWLTHQLTVARVVAKLESILGCSIAAIPGSAAELAFDIDAVGDLTYARSLSRVNR
jgi:GTP:adenosylcobinamide-phosphate guanylyltransferase